MSDSVRDLLVRGVAAAKYNDKDEARYYLEWVLRRSDADPEQQAEAWLWLSQVRETPAERRECLENVLAIDPAHPLARRGLAILNGKLKPEEVIDPLQAPQPVAPTPTPGASDVRRYVCPKCGGKMTFASDRRALTCGYCGNKMWEYEAIKAGALVREQDFAATLPTARAHRWQLPTARTLTCQGCGATITLPPLQIAATCPFCGSAHIVTATEVNELIQPEGVLPFQFDAGTAARHIREWLERQRFRPGDLNEAAAIDTPRGVYLPFWTFDIGGEVKWNAMVLERQGDSSRWVPRTGNDLVYENDLLIPASHSLPAELLNDLIDFDTKALAPYSSDSLADWSAEVYRIAMADASLVARQRVLNQSKKQVRDRTLGGETVRDLGFSTAGIAIESYKLALLPVWVAGYRYKGQHYRVVVNGQTGTPAGQVPRSGLGKLMAGLFGNG